MGTKDQKVHLTTDIIDVSMEYLKVAIATCSSTVSCFYRLALGTARKLHKIMSISAHIPDNHIIIKYGFKGTRFYVFIKRRS